MSKRTHARLNPPAMAVSVIHHEDRVEVTDPEPITPVRNRAERRALIRALTRRRPDGSAAPRQGAMPRV